MTELNTIQRRQFLKRAGHASLLTGIGASAVSTERLWGAVPEQPLPFELLICDYVQFKLARVNQQGKMTWSHVPPGKVWDFVLLDDSLVYPIITDVQEVRRVDFDGNVKWSWPYRQSYREIINITRSGGELVISGQMPPEAILMGLDGKIQKKIPLPAKYPHHHGQLGNVYAVKDGHYLVQLWGEGTVLEVDGEGQEVWRYQVSKTSKGRYPEGTVQDVLRLRNGHTMVACGTQARVLELDQSGELIWEFDASDHPELNFTNACSLQQLKDDSILVTNFLRGNTGRGAHAFRLSRERELIWTYGDHQNFSAASQVWAIEA
jgi:hypothetical protein